MSKRIEKSTSPSAAATNGEGMTFREWWQAANAFRAVKLSIDKTLHYRNEWRRGVDPTEYADSTAK